MSHNKNHDSQQLPVGRLGIISPYSCAELGTKVDNYLVSWRKNATMKVFYMKATTEILT